MFHIIIQKDLVSQIFLTLQSKHSFWVPTGKKMGKLALLVWQWIPNLFYPLQFWVRSSQPILYWWALKTYELISEYTHFNIQYILFTSRSWCFLISPVNASSSSVVFALLGLNNMFFVNLGHLPSTYSLSVFFA